MNMKHKYLSSLKFWVLIAVLTILWAIFREGVFIPLTGMNPTLARAVLLPVQIAYIIGLSWLYMKKARGLFSASQTWLLGALWLALTILFEFSFGMLVMKHSFVHLLADYNIFAGKTWVLFLIAVFVAPYVGWRIAIKNNDDH